MPVALKTCINLKPAAMFAVLVYGLLLPATHLHPPQQVGLQEPATAHLGLHEPAGHLGLHEPATHLGLHEPVGQAPHDGRHVIPNSPTPALADSEHTVAEGGQGRGGGVGRGRGAGVGRGRAGGGVVGAGEHGVVRGRGAGVVRGRGAWGGRGKGAWGGRGRGAWGS